MVVLQVGVGGRAGIHDHFSINVINMNYITWVHNVRFAYILNHSHCIFELINKYFVSLGVVKNTVPHY